MVSTFDLDDPKLLELARSRIEAMQPFQINVPSDRVVQLRRSTHYWRIAEESTGLHRTLAWIRTYAAAFGLRQYWMVFVLAQSKRFDCLVTERDGMQWVQFSPQHE